MPNYIAGIGSQEPRLLIVGESPNRTDNDRGQPFSGAVGELLADALYRAGVHISECYLTYAIKYQLPFGDFEKAHLGGMPDIDSQVNDLWEYEIKVFRPNCILAVGDRAFRAVMGYPLIWGKKDESYPIRDYRGSILKGKDNQTKVVPTFNIGDLFSSSDKGGLSYVNKKLIEFDVARAVQESLTPNFDLPIRTHSIATSSLDVYRFRNEYKNKTKLSIDIESINCIPVSIALSYSKHHSMTVPLLSRIGTFSLTDMSRREVAQCWKDIQEELLTKDLVGQNLKYDDYKLTQSGFKVGRVTSDTLLKAHMIFPELPDKRLSTLSSLWTREPFYKDEGKEPKIGKHFNVERFFIYNGKDAAVTLEVDEEMESDLIGLAEQFKVPLVDFYYNYVMRKHKLYLKMENVGFVIDENRRDELRKEFTEQWNDVHDKIEKAVGREINVKSSPVMYDLLYKEMGFPTRKREPTSEDSIIALLNTHCKGKRAEYAETLKDILTERRLRDQLSRAINFSPDYDGRLKSSYKIEATETSRSVTNILKKPVRPKKIGLAFHTIPTHGPLGKKIKSFILPDKGKVLIKCDSSQAEARIVAVLAEDYQLLEAFDKVDIHRRTAGLFFGLTRTLILTTEEVPIVDYLEKDGPERFTGKMFRHAGNYNMKKGRAANEFNVNAQKFGIPMEISEWKANVFIELFHGASPKIREVFHKSISEQLQEFRSLINPFGRPRVFNARMGDELFNEGFAYIPQSTVADLVQSAAIKIDDELNGNNELVFCGEKHDELVYMAPEKNWMQYAKLIKKHMQFPIDFSQYCSLKRDYTLTIPADIEVSLNKNGDVTNMGDCMKIKVDLD